nr:RNA-directed DNA polymerase, eukaryota [Tanacetum cinerariifolium]
MDRHGVNSHEALLVLVEIGMLQSPECSVFQFLRDELDTNLVSNQYRIDGPVFLGKVCIGTVSNGIPGPGIEKSVLIRTFRGRGRGRGIMIVFHWMVKHRSRSKESSLFDIWVIKAMYGDCGALDNTGTFVRSSTWTTIVCECRNLSSKGNNLLSHTKKKVGNGANNLFWVDSWLSDIPLMQLYLRMFALDCNKISTVKEKINASSISSSFRRQPRGSFEEEKFFKLIEDVNSVTLSISNDRWIWSLNSLGKFSIKSTRLYIHDHLLLEVRAPTRWVKEVPIKINIMAWKASLDKLPTRLNLSLRGINLHRVELESKPVLVLDDSCLNQNDMSRALMGKVKVFDSLWNLKLVLANEGSDDIKLKYMSGLWVLIEFQANSTKEKFMANSSVASWFSHLQQATHNVFIDERVIWLDIEVVCGWSPDFVEEEENESEYDDVVSKEGDQEANGGLHNPKSSDGDSDVEEVSHTIYEKSRSQIPNKEGCNGEQECTHSDDPFNIYGLLNKKKDSNNDVSSSYSNLKFPPGFTPPFVTEDKSNNKNGSVDENKNGSVYVQEKLNWGHWNFKRCWGNFNFDHVYSPSVSNSGGILCVWDPRVFRKDNSSVSDYFVMVRGEWIQNGKMILIISIYAPQELSEKKMLWDYLSLVIGNWQGDVIIKGDFNEVRKQKKIYGTVFNVHGADAFSLFILNAGLEKIHLGSCSFTWCHKTASKMSKLDRFLIYEGIVSAYPNIFGITLDRYLSDHHPILMSESKFDYGLTPFRFFHYWFDINGFDEFVKNTWNDAQVTEHNAM